MNFGMHDVGRSDTLVCCIELLAVDALGKIHYVPNCNCLVKDKDLMDHCGVVWMLLLLPWLPLVVQWKLWVDISVFFSFTHDGIAGWSFCLSSFIPGAAAANALGPDAGGFGDSTWA